LSIGGCFLDMLNPSPKSTEIRVTIFHAGDVFTALGRVAFVIPNMGMGVAFTTVEGNQVTVLKKWLLGLSVPDEGGDRPEEFPERADQVLYEKKRSSKEFRGAANGVEPKRTPFHALVDLVCPHCGKGNLVALDTHSDAGDSSQNEVKCAHCREVWETPLPGPIMSGPFPK
jgi:DNA-directed RNA polymerase subunit M/transcription elongation factor TFIIS